MPGKSCSGIWNDVNPRPGLARAHCEGRDAAAAGALDTTNPHEAGSEGAAMWAVGFASWDEGDPATFLRDCCATIQGGGWVGP